MDYTHIKLIHQSAVALSALGFALRGWGSLRGAAWVQGRLAKTLPHGVDTVLLASALALAGVARLEPLQQPWLMAKILGLLLYIALGMVVMRPRFAWGLRATLWVLALLLLAWMASVAVLKNPLGLFALLP